MKRLLLLLSCIMLMNVLSAQQKGNVSGVVTDETGEKVPMAYIAFDSIYKTTADIDGNYSIKNIPFGEHTLVVIVSFSSPYTSTININQAQVTHNIQLKTDAIVSDTVEVNYSKYNDLDRKMDDVDHHTITAGKKTETIHLEEMVINTSTNNAREGYSKISGANIWESDNYGIQLGIGVRGLSPNRSANFNVRQNGYDISADAIGYPESYYTPAFAGLEKIEIIRGAASLQFGPQFGGMLNFRFKKGPKDEKAVATLRQTVGSFGFLNTFLSLGGQVGKTNYYGYYNYKQANGWRPNSEFNHNNLFIGLDHQISKRLSVNIEFTYMNYLAHQAGGLTDLQFDEDPRQSNRERNWFKVNWNLLAVNFDYKINDRSSINVRNFGLIASRDALGKLERIDRIDDGGPRNLISDQYKNFGNETRYLLKYKLKKDSLNTDSSALVAGVRFYRGHTTSRQGMGSSGNDADFTFYDDKNIGGSDYTFPNTNVALFIENQFKLSKRLSIIPGVRYEYISTNANGYYNQVSQDFAGNIIGDTTIYENSKNNRGFLLFGIGGSYKTSKVTELYGNIAQNYRPVTFGDIRINNPNKKVDENIHDENGYNADLGFRGNILEKFVFDVSGFLMVYNDRIGSIYEAEDQAPYRNLKVVRNIADARIYGIEAFAETDLIRVFTSKTVSDTKNKLNWFVNTSIMNGEYINTENTSIKGKKVELIPQFTFKTGLTFKYHDKLSSSLLFSSLSEQYTDATNEPGPVPSAVIGVIPAYYVMDLGFAYEFNRSIKVETGINNLTNNSYYTRRADGYPGPGIIPSDGRSFYFTLQLKLAASQLKKKE